MVLFAAHFKAHGLAAGQELHQGQAVSQWIGGTGMQPSPSGALTGQNNNL